MKPLRWLYRKTVRLAEMFVFFFAIPFVIWAGNRSLLFGVMRQSKDQETEAMLIIDGVMKSLNLDQAHRVLQGAYSRYVAEPVSVIVAKQVVAARQEFEGKPAKGETFH